MADSKVVTLILFGIALFISMNAAAGGFQGCNYFNPCPDNEVCRYDAKNGGAICINPCNDPTDYCTRTYNEDLCKFRSAKKYCKGFCGLC